MSKTQQDYPNTEFFREQFHFYAESQAAIEDWKGRMFAKLDEEQGR